MYVPRIMVSLYYGDDSAVGFEKYHGIYLVGQDVCDSVLRWTRDSELMLVII